MSNVADVILRLLATSASDSNKSSRKGGKSRHSSDEEISEGEMTDRSDDQEDDDDDDDDDDEGPVDEYDDDYFGDAKDRAELMAMPEVDREQVLFERAKKRTQLLDHRQVARRLKRQEEANRNSKKGSSSAGRDSARRSTRAKDSKAGSTKALADLKKAQERKRARRSHSPEKRRRAGSEDYSDKSRSSSSDEDVDYDSEPDKKKSKSVARKPAGLEDLNNIRLGRDRLEKWCYSPFFKDTVVGCFVRLSLGPDSNRQPVYRITEIIGVSKQSKIYQVGSTMTNLTLTLKHGKAEKGFTMDIISNGAFTEDEFRRYESVMRSEKIDLVTQEHVENKRKDIDHAKEYVLTDKEVEAILELKRQMKQGRLNPVVHRTILEQQKMAQTHEEAEETERRLQELKEAELAQKNSGAGKLDLWAKLNERNRTLNRTSGREAEIGMAQQKKQKGTGSRDVDPFARRKTVPKIYYDNVSSPASSAKDSGASSPAPSVTLATAQSFAATPAMPQSRWEEVVLAMKDDLNMDVDVDEL